MRKLPLLLLLAPSLLFAAPHKRIQITLTPMQTTLVANTTQQFTATVSGTNNNGVTWSSSAGTISNGLFTAPAVTQSSTIYVSATSIADPTKIATAAITVTPGSGHVVDLNWSPSTSDDVSGYNVYRGVDPGGPYSQVNTGGLVASTLYSDSSVASGQTYYYVVTAVDSSGIESGDSNETQAVVPSP